MPNINDQPTNVLTHILTTATTHDDLLAHVALCARVHPEWRRAVMGSAAYGLGIVGRSADKGATETAATEALRALNIGGLSRRAKELGIGEEMLEALQDDDEPKQALIRWLAPRDPGATAAEERSRVLRTVSTALRQAKADGKLDLAETHVGDAGAVALEAAVRALSSPLALTELKMTGWLLTAAGMATVAALMRGGHLGSSQLKLLNVSGNDLGDAGVTALAAVLPPTLEDFSFTNVGCGDAGMLAMARALPATRVELLLCDRNPAVTEAGWTALGAALPTTGADRLVVHGNLGHAGTTSLAESLPESTVRSLDLLGCDAGDAGVRALAAAIPRCPQLVALKLDSTISANGTAALQAAADQRDVSGFTLSLPGWSSWTAAAHENLNDDDHIIQFTNMHQW